MKKKIAVLPGDGIGPEVTSQSIKVLNAIAKRFNHEFTFEEGLFVLAQLIKQVILFRKKH